MIDAKLIETYRDGLIDDTVPFWIRHGVDREHGGFFTSLDRDGTLIDSDKGMWQQARFTWLLGELYNEVEPRAEWLALAKSGAEFIDRHGFDPEDGRMWFHVTREGRPVRKRRYAFSESFAAIAYGELSKATQDLAWAQKAQRAFRRFVDHRPESEKFTSTRPTRGLGVPLITIGTAQELRDSIGLDDADHWIDRSIDSIRQYHLNQELECVMESVGVEGEFLDHFDGRILNPGHAIEAAWFILYEAKVRGDSSLIALGCQMLDWMWERGWDKQHGGILYFVDAKGLPVQEYWHDMKFWWPQNEAIIATLLAYVLTGDEKYAKWHRKVHEWAYKHFPDPKHGEWYGYLHRDGSVSSRLKGNLWKGPFHLPRMQLLCARFLSEFHGESR